MLIEQDSLLAVENFTDVQLFNGFSLVFVVWVDGVNRVEVDGIDDFCMFPVDKVLGHSDDFLNCEMVFRCDLVKGKVGFYAFETALEQPR